MSARYASSVASNSEGSTWCKISRWTSIWFTAGTTTGENVKSEPATVHRVLSMIMAYAMKDGRLAVNPAAGVSLPRVREPEKRYLTERRVAELADAVGEEYRLIVLFLAYTGLRWREMAALRVGRLDLLRRRVLVAESVTPGQGGNDVRSDEGTPASRGPAAQVPHRGAGSPRRDKSAADLVFIGEPGAVMRSQTFQRAVLTRAATDLGIPDFHPHELRHTAASLAIASGADIKIVQQMLGHKSAVMTLDQYGHLFGDRLDIVADVADAMDAARTSALAGGYPVGTGGKVVQLRRDAK